MAAAAGGAAPPALPPGAVVHGTCGWSDQRFYPPGTRDAESKLRFFSSCFGCVEVDTSCYAIPSAAVTAKWAKAAAPHFRFFFKAFGLLASQSCQLAALPGEARAMLPPGLLAQLQAAQQQPHVRLSELPAAAHDCVWRLFHAALEPVYQAGKLGAVLFQYHLSFVPSAANLEYLLSCRRRLDARFAMAAELRCRAWFTDAAWRSRLCEALQAHGIALVSADELAHETVQKDREQRGLPPGVKRELLPIAVDVTAPSWHYVRVHRRFGMLDRLLPQAEIEAWAQRIQQQLAPQLQGPVYFMWGTDWEDVPIRNARALDAALPPALTYDWRQYARQAALRKPGSIGSFFLSQGSSQPRQQQQQQTGSEAAADHPAAGTPVQQRMPSQQAPQQSKAGQQAPPLKKRSSSQGIARFFTASAEDAPESSKRAKQPG